MDIHILRLPDGTQVTSGQSAQTALQSVKLTESVNSGTELAPGAVCAAMLEATVVDAGDLTLTAGEEVTLLRQSGDEEIPLGRFLLEKPTRQSGGKLQLTGYDRVSLLDQDLTGWLTALDGWPYRLDTFAAMVCQAVGLEIDTEELPNGDYLIQKFSATGITGRQLLSWAAQAAGKFVRARPDGALEFAWYTPAEAVGPTGARFYYQGTLRYEDYACEAVQRVRIQRTADDVGVAWPDNEGEANTYSVTGNYLLTASTEEALLPIAQSLYELLNAVTYTPCSLTVPQALGVRAGDILPVTDGGGKSFSTCVMSCTLSGGRAALSATGSPRRDSPTALAAASYQALSGRMLEIRATLEGLRIQAQALSQEAEATREQLAALSLTAQGMELSLSDLYRADDQQSADLAALSDSLDSAIDKTGDDIAGLVSRLAELQLQVDSLNLSFTQIRDTGVDQVTTKTGYTFNADGLDIHRSGDEIHNTIDNTGMYVRRGQGEAAETMLQANAAGVVATDLTARNYLIVGTHARFEDYGEGRTACFYLGGGL